MIVAIACGACSMNHPFKASQLGRLDREYARPESTVRDVHGHVLDLTPHTEIELAFDGGMHVTGEVRDLTIRDGMFTWKAKTPGVVTGHVIQIKSARVSKSSAGATMAGIALVPVVAYLLVLVTLAPMGN